MAQSLGSELFDMGFSFFNKKDYTKAEAHFCMALEKRCKKKKCKTMPDVLAWVCLSMLYQNKYEEALILLEKQPPSEETFSKFGDLLLSRSKLKQFCKERRVAIEKCRKAKHEFGEKSVDYGIELLMVGDVLFYQKDQLGVMEYYDQAKTLVPKTHFAYSQMIDRLAMLFEANDNFEQALSLRRELVQVELELRGNLDRSYAAAVNNLGNLYAKMTLFRLAVEHLAQALTILERNSKPDDYDASCIRKGIAAYQKAMKDKAYAAELATAITDKRMCNMLSCGKVANKDDLYRCSACMNVYYCSEACQHADWLEVAKHCVVIARCAGCNVEADEMQWCSGCHGPRYCSKECQLLDWKNGHKSECKKNI
jgi:tetratricopeptide (TPR) repeat protein